MIAHKREVELERANNIQGHHFSPAFSGLAQTDVISQNTVHLVVVKTTGDLADKSLYDALDTNPSCVAFTEADELVDKSGTATTTDEPAAAKKVLVTDDEVLFQTSFVDPTSFAPISLTIVAGNIVATVAF